MPLDIRNYFEQTQGKIAEQTSPRICKFWSEHFVYLSILWQLIYVATTNLTNSGKTQIYFQLLRFYSSLDSSIFGFLEKKVCCINSRYVQVDFLIDSIHCLENIKIITINISFFFKNCNHERILSTKKWIKVFFCVSKHIFKKTNSFFKAVLCLFCWP